MKKFLLLLLVCASALMAQDSKQLLSRLDGIVIYNSWDLVRKESVDNIDTVTVMGVKFLQNHPEFIRSLSDAYIGRPLTEEGLIALQAKIGNFYEEHNQPFVLVSVPQQQMKKSIVQIVVEEAKLGKVIARGNRCFPTRWLEGAIRTRPGETILAQRVFEDVAWLNLNPFRRTDAIYKPGNQPGTVDLELVTIDRWPYRVYMGGDNTGTEATNRNRIFFGFNFGKSVLKDGQISYQFSCAPNWNLFYAHTASARLPLPWRHIWDLWGGYTQVEPYPVAYRHKNKGVSWQVDTRYRIPFFASQKFMQTLVVGYDFKETNNTIEYGGVKISHTSADINQFMMGYEWGYRVKSLRTSVVAEMYGNPGGITHDNQTKFYERLRYGAKNHYLYGKLAHSLAKEWRYGGISYDFTGQASSANLLPSEQLTMTGYNAVRGFEERILNLDTAFIFNFSLETPRVSPAKRFGFCKEWDQLYLLAFFDCGYGGNHTLAPGEAARQSLGSIGPGLRYQIDRYFTARLDYGYQLWDSGFHNPSHSRYNFGMILSY